METLTFPPKTPDEFKKLLKQKTYWDSRNPKFSYQFFESKINGKSQFELIIRDDSIEVKRKQEEKRIGHTIYDIQKENDIFYLILDDSILPNQDNENTKKVEIKNPKEGFLEFLPLDGSPHIYTLLQDYKPTI